MYHSKYIPSSLLLVGQIHYNICGALCNAQAEQRTHSLCHWFALIVHALVYSSQFDVYIIGNNNMKSTKVQTLGVLRMRGTTN